MPTHGWKLALILVAALAVYLVGNDRTALFDRDEPRYAQCSRQMLQSGDWVVPRLYDKLRAAKGPGIYWCQATMMSVLGDTPFAARLPSALAAVLTAALVGAVVWRQVGPRHAVWTVFILVTSALMIWSSKICLTDVVQLLFITIALLCIYLLWRGKHSWKAVVGLAVSIACAGLIKGPFILGVLGGTVGMMGVLYWVDRKWPPRKSGPLSLRERVRVREDVADAALEASSQLPLTPTLSRRERGQMPSLSTTIDVCLKIVVGLAIIAALVAPWVYLIRQRAPEFLKAASADLRQHLEKGSEGHTAPPGYHLLMIWVTWMPWCLFLPLTLVLAWQNRKTPEIRFALAAVLGTWVFVEILQTKLPHYILPAFPALAFLTADVFVRNFRGEREDLRSKEIRIAAVVLSAVVALVSTLPFWWLSIHYHDFPWVPLVLLTLAGPVIAATVATLFLQSRPMPAVVTMGCGALGLASILFGLYLPDSQPLRVPVRVADVLKAHDAVHRHDALMLEYKEPSLAFYQGGTIREYDYSLEQIAHDPASPRWVVTTLKVWEQTPSAIRDCFDMIGDPIRGLDYSDAMKTVDVVVVRKK
jgi:4-amino-4-deoxy-L-arabinose transferase-like glycosyltransferase